MIVSLSETDPLYKITVLPGSAVPSKTGLEPSGSILSELGTLGAVVSIVIDNG